jgi:hypothetical protein
MAAGSLYVFTTDELTTLLGLDPKKDKWRVVKFAESREYKIVPSIKLASGSGSRRLYDLENVCEFALALQLLQVGLRAKVIGSVIQKLRKEGKMRTYLNNDEIDLVDLTLVVERDPEPGAPLNKNPMIYLQSNGDKLTEYIAETFANAVDARDLILVRIGHRFINLKFQLAQLRPEWAKENS